MVVEEGTFGDNGLRPPLYCLEKGLEHAFEVLNVHCLQQEEGKRSKIHVSADSHQGSDVPAVEVVFLVDCQEEAVSILPIVGLHLLIEDDHRLGDAPAIPLEPRGHGLCQDGVPLALQPLDDLVDFLAVVELVAVLDPFLGLGEELLEVLLLESVYF